MSEMADLLWNWRLCICLFVFVLPSELVATDGSVPTSRPTTTISINHHNISSNVSNDTTNPPVITTMHVTPEPTTEQLPVKSPEEEREKSMEIFFILLVVGLCILVIYFLIKHRFHYLPESVAVVFLGALVGLITRFFSHFNVGNWVQDEELDPTVFFLILLPPIIFESGYSLHKGNFFANIGTIILFAVLGTAISAAVIGGGVYILGQAGLVFKLSIVESFAFGSMISAVDPVATLAIFHALDVDPTLNMLVFGESVLNDAVSIVMTNTVVGQNDKENNALSAVGRFFSMFIGSACIGIAFALLSALLLKHINLRRIPSLELAFILIFSYVPYGLAEGLKLSGIMAILFCGIVMSHYTHFNLSSQTQVTVQQIFRTIAFMTETCIFAYLGMAIFSLKHNFKPAFVAWSIVLCLLGRAVNIFPLSFLANLFRSVKISRKMQCIMWFSGLRGAVAFALSTQLQFGAEQRSVLVTSTLVIVLFTILCLGGATLPLLKCLQAERNSHNYDITLSKTEVEDKALDSEQITDDEWRLPRRALTGFARLDAKYFIPFFSIHRPSRTAVNGTTSERTNLTNLYSEESDDTEGEINQTADQRL